MDNIRKNQIDHEFIAKAEAEVKKLDKGAKVFVIIGNNRNIRRSVDNSELDIIVLNIKEKEEVERRIEFTRRYRLQQENRNYGEAEKIEDKSISNVNTRKNVTNKPNNVKKDVKKQANKNKKKKYQLSAGTKGKLKEFFKNNGVRIGVGITALAVMGTLASESLKERAENIQRYNNEFNSIEQVEKIIIDEVVQEYKKASNKNNIELDIERVPAGDLVPEGVLLTVTDLVEDNQTKYIKRRDEIIRSDMHKKFAQMLEAYLNVSEIAENAKMYNEEVSDSKKNKAIKELKKVEDIAKEYDFEVKEDKFTFFNSDDKRIVRASEQNDRDDR